MGKSPAQAVQKHNDHYDEKRGGKWDLSLGILAMRVAVKFVSFMYYILPSYSRVFICIYKAIKSLRIYVYSFTTVCVCVHVAADEQKRIGSGCSQRICEFNELTQ